MESVIRRDVLLNTINPEIALCNYFLEGSIIPGNLNFAQSTEKFIFQQLLALEFVLAVIYATDILVKVWLFLWHFRGKLRSTEENRQHD